MKRPIRRTTRLTLKERNVVFVGELFLTALLRLTLMGPDEVQSVVELVESHRPGETDSFGTRVAYQRLLELLADIQRDYIVDGQPAKATRRQLATARAPFPKSIDGHRRRARGRDQKQK